MNIELAHVAVRYGETTAIEDLSLELTGTRITGLFGRNGAGKTTLLRCLAGLRPVDGGTLTVDGHRPFDHPVVMARSCLVSDRLPAAADLRVSEAIELAELLRPDFDSSYARQLLDRFAVPADKKQSKMSRGKQAAFSVALGLATRAPLTMFDEAHLGMDAAARELFYDELLADYGAHPRSIIVSTHLIDEVAELIEDVVVIDSGRLVSHDSAEDLRGRAVELTGPVAVVDELVHGRQQLGRRQLGDTAAVVVLAAADEVRQFGAHRAVRVDSVPLQTLINRLTDDKEP